MAYLPTLWDSYIYIYLYIYTSPTETDALFTRVVLGLHFPLQDLLHRPYRNSDMVSRERRGMWVFFLSAAFCWWLQEYSVAFSVLLFVWWTAGNTFDYFRQRKDLVSLASSWSRDTHIFFQHLSTNLGGVHFLMGQPFESF